MGGTPVQTQVVQTAWAAMALMYAEYPHRGPIERAVKLTMDRQLPVCIFSIQIEANY
jgi:squalene cyclase